MMHHLGYFHPIGFVFFLLLLGFLITNIILWKRRRGGCYNHPYNNALAILENRLASGEIDTDEYRKIKETLTK